MRPAARRRGARRRRPPTAFERGLHALGLLILRLTAFLVLFVLLAHLAFHRPALESFLFAVALAVGLTPELLPMVTTVTLSRGAKRMAAKRVVVKRLAAIHDLGAMDVLCTDKTGTLTEARIALAEAIRPGRQPGRERVLALAALNAGLATGRPTSLDAAILAAARPRPGWRALAEAPFGFERRRSSVLCRGRGAAAGGEGRAGSRAGRLHHGRGHGAFDRAATRWRWPRRGGGAAAARHRAAGGAARGRIAGPAAERDLVFAGFCAFLDPPKQSAGAAVARLAALGRADQDHLGDTAPVVRHLVETLGLPSRGLLTGEEIRRWTRRPCGPRRRGAISMPASRPTRSGG